MKKRFNRTGAPTGFTLLELLVVVGIIVVLASLLLSVLAKGKTAAKAAACKSNLRQLGIALNMYVADYNKFPGPRPTADYGLLWLLPYLSLPNNQLGFILANESGGILRCPAKPPRLVPGLFTNSPFSLMYEYGYGYNQYGTEDLVSPSRELGLGWFPVQVPSGPVVLILIWPPPPPPIRFVSESDVRVPSQMLALGDVSGWGDVVTPRKYSVADHHNGGANFVFCDGHVEYGRQSKWIEPSDAARRYWNSDNKPHPETW